VASLSFFVSNGTESARSTRLGPVHYLFIFLGLYSLNHSLFSPPTTYLIHPTRPDTLANFSISPPPHPSRASVMTNMSTTSYTPRHSRTTSPPLSVATPSTVGPQTQRLNVVTRLTVEGNAKRAESVPIKMYMKVCRPLSTTPAHLIYLCHEARSSCGQHCSWERDSALQRLAPSLSIVAQC
jgi:hypothetical protein